MKQKNLIKFFLHVHQKCVFLITMWQKKSDQIFPACTSKWHLQTYYVAYIKTASDFLENAAAPASAGLRPAGGRGALGKIDFSR